MEIVWQETVVNDILYVDFRVVSISTKNNKENKNYV